MQMLSLNVSDVTRPVVHCPACGQAILDMEGGDYSEVVGSCPHLLCCWVDEPDDFDYMAPDLKLAYEAALAVAESQSPDDLEDELPDDAEEWGLTPENWGIFTGLVPESSSTFVLQMCTWASGCGGDGVAFRLAFDFARTAPASAAEDATKA